jgi:hypothetical protein
LHSQLAVVTSVVIKAGQRETALVHRLTEKARTPLWSIRLHSIC